MTLVQIVQCLGMYRMATLTALTPLIILSVYEYMWNIYNYTITNNPFFILIVYKDMRNIYAKTNPNTILH